MLTLWLSAVDAEALAEAALSLSDALFTSDADSLADFFTLFDKLSLSEVDFDTLSLAEADLLSDSLVALLVLVLWLSAVDADALTDAALSLSDALFTSDADSLADAALFDKLSLSEVDFDTLSFAEVEADLLSAVLLLVDSLTALLVLTLWLSAVDAEALAEAALSLSDALFTSDADSLADFALFDKLSLSEVDFDALSLAEADLLSAVLLLVDSLTALLALVLWLSAVDADALTDAALSLSDALFTSDADSLADAALFDKLSLSEVDFEALSLAETDLLIDSLVTLLVLVL